MAYHYKANDEDEDFKDLDPAVAEDMAFAKALQNSLESFAQEQGDTAPVPENDDKVPDDTRGAPDDTHEVPQFSFTAEEIARDDLRREEELYGPPSPLKESCTATSLNLQNDATKPSEKKSEKTSANSSLKDARKHVANDTTAKGIAKSDVAANKASSAPKIKIKIKIKSDPLAERVLAIKMAALLGTIECPDAYSEAPQGLPSGLVGANSPNSSTGGVAGSDPGHNSLDWSADIADMAMSSQALGSPVAADTSVENLVLEDVDTTVPDDTETAAVGNTATPEGSPLDTVVALSGLYDANESGRLGQDFDDRIARAHAARVAAIEAELASQHVDLEAALSAHHAGRTTRGVPVAVSEQAARNQIASAGPSRREAGDSAGDDEMDWLLDEFPVSPRPGSKEAQSPRQRFQHQ